MGEGRQAAPPAPRSFAAQAVPHAFARCARRTQEGRPQIGLKCRVVASCADVRPPPHRCGAPRLGPQGRSHQGSARPRSGCPQSRPHPQNRSLACNTQKLQESGRNVVKKVKEGYKVVSEKSGKNLGGPYRTKKEAIKRLRQVEFFKRMKG